MFDRFAVTMLFAVIGAVVATAITAVTAAAAFLTGVYIGGQDTETEDTKK